MKYWRLIMDLAISSIFLVLILLDNNSHDTWTLEEIWYQQKITTEEESYDNATIIRGQGLEYNLNSQYQEMGGIEAKPFLHTWLTYFAYDNFTINNRSRLHPVEDATIIKCEE